ncbi:MAG: MAPEG family protein [Candidatus Devosia symbiotica]|nr:MAPEG family protein [Candidatus Devosia symbiotica]
MGRARRALTNFQETLPIFITLAVLSMVSRTGCRWLAPSSILLGRVAYVVCYVGGLSPWRSISFTVVLVGMETLCLSRCWAIGSLKLP